MKRQTYRTKVYGGKYSGETEEHSSSDELVLNRKEIAYVMKALRRGNKKDKAFAKKMFDTLASHKRCDCCGISHCEENLCLMHGKKLCHKCWHIMSDVDFCLKEYNNGYKSLISVQKAREDWMDKKLNYLVNVKTYDRCVKRYYKLFGKRGNT